MSAPTPPTTPPPGPGAALMLTAAAWSVTLLSGVAFSAAGLPGPGLAVGHVLAYGGLGTLVARAVPEPAERRLGLRGMAPRWLLPILLLAPSVLLLSELDNVVQLLLPRAQAASTEVAPLALLEFGLFSVLLRPALEEFFFRGVLQQGVTAALGRLRGVAFVAALYATVHGTLMATDASSALSLVIQALLEGLVLGLLREASGSILPGMVLRALVGGIGMLAVAGAKDWVVPGFNAPGPHTPLVWLAPAAASVALGLVLVVRALRERAALPPPAPPAPDA